MTTLSDTTVVFDLDDTLYQEVDYQMSGYNSIIELCNSLYGINVGSMVNQAIEAKADVLEAITKELDLPDSVKESLLWQYRLHHPQISLLESIKATLDFIKKNAKHVAILTDGRELSQRQKLAGLGLTNWPVFISEAWGENKPGEKRFKHIMQEMPAKNFVYIGDNIKKDFITPNKLGWLTVGVRDSGRNIHSQNIKVEQSFLPKYWLNTLQDLNEILN
ncbi:HAD family hydrolase [Vibrio cyclitrophicus]